MTTAKVTIVGSGNIPTKLQAPSAGLGGGFDFPYHSDDLTRQRVRH